MRSIQLRSLLLLSCAGLVPAFTAYSQTLHTQNFDSLANESGAGAGGYSFSGAPFYVYSGDGLPAAQAAGQISAFGVGGSQAISASVSYTNGGYWYGGLGTNSPTFTLPTTDLSQLSFTADVAGLGFSGTGNFILQLRQFPTAARTGGTQNFQANFPSSASTAGEGVYQTVGGLLSIASTTGALDVNNTFFQITVLFRNEGATWGLDSGNTLQVDNIAVSAIPEPATGAMLVGAAVLVGVASRRRRRPQVG